MVLTPSSVAVVALYAGILGLVGLVLAALVVVQRGKTRTDLGSGGHPSLERAIRVHGNFIEYVPLILLLMLVCELSGVRLLWLHVMGVALVLGRVFHAWGLWSKSGTSFGRFAGITLTWAVLLAAAALCLVRGAMMLAVQAAPPG
jgi:hypothetical protein